MKNIYTLPYISYRYDFFHAPPQIITISIANMLSFRQRTSTNLRAPGSAWTDVPVARAARVCLVLGYVGTELARFVSKREAGRWLGHLLFGTHRRPQVHVWMCVGCTINQFVDIAEVKRSSDGDVGYINCLRLCEYNSSCKHLRPSTSGWLCRLSI